MPEPAQVLGHLEQVLAARRIDLLAQSDELPRSHSSPRATSAYVVPDFLCSSTAFCLNSGVYLGEGGGFHSCLQSSVARIMRNGNQLVNGNRADSDL